MEEPLRYRVESIRTSGNALDIIQAIKELLDAHGLRPEVVNFEGAIDRVSLLREERSDGDIYEIELW